MVHHRQWQGLVVTGQRSILAKIIDMGFDGARLNKESLLTGLAGENVPNREVDVDWSYSRLKRAQSDGVRMLATEYLSDPGLKITTDARLRDWGFLPFFGARALDRQPWG